MNFQNYKKVKDLYSNKLVSTVSLWKHCQKQEYKVKKQIYVSERQRQTCENQFKFVSQIDSPHVVKCFNSINQGKIYCIWMEYYENGDLQQFLIKKDLKFDEKMNIFIDILVGLRELHKKYIIHRDLKLNNIFIDQHERAIVADLGASTRTGGVAQTNIGTNGYKAPQITGVNSFYDEKVDIFSLGVIAFAIFNNKYKDSLRYPFKEQEKIFKNLELGYSINNQRSYKLISHLEEFDSDVPEVLQQMIKSMLQPDPKKRLCWSRFYTNEYLKNYDKHERLITFKADYLSLQDNKLYYTGTLQFIDFSIEKYYEPIIGLLRQNSLSFQGNNQNDLFNLALFCFLNMERIIKKIKDLQFNQMGRLLTKRNRKKIKQIKNQSYDLGLKLNLILKKTGKNIQNKEFKENSFYQKLQKECIQILQNNSTG